jgi:hypothetical protein
MRCKQDNQERGKRRFFVQERIDNRSPLLPENFFSGDSGTRPGTLF